MLVLKFGIEILVDYEFLCQEIWMCCMILVHFTTDEFVPETHIQNFLNRQFFLDEFQRVFEDEKYR